MFTTTPATVAAVITDDELLQRIAGRDEHAFAQLYRRHIAPAHATARRVCRDLADDATQEAFFALWQDAPTFRPRAGGAAGWLHTIVRNRSLDLRRQAAVRERRFVLDERALLDAASERPGPDDVVAAAQRRTQIRAAIADLPAPQRDVIALAYFDDLTQTEIAAHRSVALGTVKGRTRLALRRLAGDPALAHT
jgi:RNA polymerase sigma-70 factor (ECF subfamily)